jgi:hypothetical protein
MKFTTTAFFIMTAMVPSVSSQHAAETANGQMLLRGHLLEQQKHEALQAAETATQETGGQQQATPLEAEVEPLENEDINEGEEEAEEEEEEEEEEATQEELEEPTQQVLMHLQEKQCEKWDERNNYPAGIICALLQDQLSRSDVLHVYAVPINDLRKAMVSTLPEDRKWNEKAFIKALDTQSEKERLYRVNNTFSVSLSYIMQDAQKHMERKSGPRGEGSKSKPSSILKKDVRKARRNQSQRRVIPCVPESRVEYSSKSERDEEWSGDDATLVSICACEPMADGVEEQPVARVYL